MIIVCKECGERFLFSEYEKKRYESKNLFTPARCPICRAAARERRNKSERVKQYELGKQKRAEEAKRYETALKKWDTLAVEEIRPSADNVLYIIGNGFDLMHKVPSSYYDFRDSMGKNSRIRTILDTFLTPEDIWADLETALGKFNMDMIAGDMVIDMFLDEFDVYDGDSGEAEYFMAVENASAPIVDITIELPKRLEKWVNTLTVGTEDRPLKDMIRPGKVLCFNYTEFIETMYGVPHENVCYIHGCRAKNNRRPSRNLILGHAPSDELSEFDTSYSNELSEYKQGMIEIARNHIIDRFIDHDEYLTKDCRKIIEYHKDFFDSLSPVSEIITVGHSFYDVDMDYYRETASRLPGAKWYFGCYSIKDLKRAEKMIETLGIRKQNVKSFRTDTVQVRENERRETAITAGVPKEKTVCSSPDGNWRLNKLEHSLYIVDDRTKEICYSVILPAPVRRGVFSEKGDRLFVRFGGSDFGLLVFERSGTEWDFVSEIIKDGFLLFSDRLRHIILSDNDIFFVYNNRELRYSFQTGELISNRAERGAGKREFNGQDIVGELK